MCQMPASNPLLKLRLRALGGVAFPATPVCLLDRHFQTVIRLRGPARPKRGKRFGKYRIPGALPLGVVESQGLHERVPGQRLTGKVCHDLFRMSRSILASASSRLRLEISASTRSWAFDFPPNSPSLPCNARKTQFAGVLADMESCLASCRIVRACSITCFTACSRYSFVYFCLGNISIQHLRISIHSG